MIRTWGVSIDYRLDIVALVFHGGSLWFLISWYKLSHGVGSCVESLKRWKISGVSRGRMRSLVSSLVIAWVAVLGITAQKIKVWKRGKILKEDLTLSYQPRFTSYLASAPGQTRLSSNGSRFQLSRSLRYQFASGKTALGSVWAKTWVSQCSKYSSRLFSKCLCFPKWKSKNISKVTNIYECYLEVFSKS